MSLLEVKKLSLQRGGQAVLHDVSFAVESGEVFVIIGPSGGGKTSLLRCLNRLEEPAPGAIFLEERDIIQLDVIALRRRIGMIFQKTAAFEGTISENVAYGPSLRGEELSRGRISELLEMVALDPGLIDRPANELSGGQEQRMAIARALANGPDVLLLDEPTSSLDPAATRQVEESLEKLRDNLDLTMIWVSHRIDQARRIGDRVLMLEDGRVAGIGDAAAMLDPENGDPQMLAFAQGASEDAGRTE